MLRRARLHPDAAVLAVAVLGVLGLLLFAQLARPPLVALEEAAAREGARVAVEARVLQADGRRLVLSDGHHRLPAWAPASQPPPARGDLVRAEGVVTRLADGPGLSLDALAVTEPAASRVLSPADLGEAPAAHDGARVRVAGEVRGDALVGEGARVRLRGEPLPARGEGWSEGAGEGDWVALGTFHYRPEEAAYVLRVEAWSRP